MVEKSSLIRKNAAVCRVRYAGRLKIIERSNEGNFEWKFFAQWIRALVGRGRRLSWRERHESPGHDRLQKLVRRDMP